MPEAAKIKKKTKKPSPKPKKQIKRPVGRPLLEFKDEYCDLLIEHMSQGFCFRTFGAVVGCSHETLYKWVREHAHFSDAKKMGTVYSLFAWEKIGLDAARGLIENFSGSSYIFNKKNRFGWKTEPDKLVDDPDLSDEDNDNSLKFRLSYNDSE